MVSPDFELETASSTAGLGSVPALMVTQTLSPPAEGVELN